MIKTGNRGGAVFAVGDLHLPGGDDKPMDVFGPQWDRHFEKICQDWRERVQGEDLVLIPGDVSWAMQLQKAVPDLEAIGALPGYKVLIRGNHDYWWSGITQVRAALPEGMWALQNDAAVFPEWTVCGSRGWTLPAEETPLAPEDEKIYRRELQRMEMSLQAGKRMGDGRPILAMTHYPPLNDKGEESGFTRLFEEYGVSVALYGHLHGSGIRLAYQGERNGVYYQLASCDALHFSLWQMPFSLLEKLVKSNH